MPPAAGAAPHVGQLGAPQLLHALQLSQLLQEQQLDVWQHGWQHGWLYDTQHDETQQRLRRERQRRRASAVSATLSSAAPTTRATTLKRRYFDIMVFLSVGSSWRGRTVRPPPRSIAEWQSLRWTEAI